ncbi:hypothetical protein [Streptomyces sp. NPDC093094]|uniref:hypothetical protein n=1 Tax=Streptomyces sp. NPDC093094 TaxID=3366026 RepID=UPI00380CF033
MTDGTVFGSYLYRLRIERGRETVSDFLRDRTIPFTANYYRDVEAGRKVLSVEAAVTLHDALGVDGPETAEYFWHYFHDVLPPEIHQALFGRRVRVTEGTLAQINDRRSRDGELHRRALALARYAREFVADEAITRSFQDDFDLLPVMTYVYMVERAAEAEVVRVCEQIGVAYGSRVRGFLAGVAEVVEEDGKRWFARRAPVLRMPRNETGVALKDRFALHETALSVDRPAAGEMFPPGGTFRHSAMVAVPESALPRIQERLADLVTEVEVAADASGQLDNPACAPYFFAVVFSGRPEYDGRGAG